MFYKNLFYIDIETVGNYETLFSFKENDEVGYNLFENKYKNNPWMQERNQTLEDAYLNYSPLFSSFGKIVCVSFGYYHDKTMQGYTVSSIIGSDEMDIMSHLQTLIDKVGKKHKILSGYFIKSFDVPWIIHKFNKYNLEIPKLLDVYIKKPWDITIIDLADEWKQQSKNSMSLNEVAYELGVLSTKDDIDGKDVHNVYWKEQNLNKIKNHCENDILNTMRVAEKMFKYKIV